MVEESYIYHLVPKPEMLGLRLYPLNQLKKVYPKLWAGNMAKYKDRTHVSAIVVPLAGYCSWHDVLFFSPVHPQKIRDGLRRAGVPFEGTLDSYQVRANLLTPERTVVMHEPETLGELPRFESYDPAVIHQYDEVPIRTLEYYHSADSQKRFLFYGIPHILYYGHFNVSGLTVVQTN